MAEHIHEVFEAALSLDQEAREEPEEVRRAWSAEIARRKREFDAGNVELIPWDVVRARVSRGR